MCKNKAMVHLSHHFNQSEQVSTCTMYQQYNEHFAFNFHGNKEPFPLKFSIHMLYTLAKHAILKA